MTRWLDVVVIVGPFLVLAVFAVFAVRAQRKAKP
jgi:hypothetical protein